MKAELVIPALHYMAARLGFEKKDYEVFPTSAGEDKFTRAISMPYGNTFDVLPEQSALAGHGNRQLLETCLYLAEKMRITAAELPEIPKEFPQQELRRIPLYLQAAINAAVLETARSNHCWSVLLHLASLGFDRDEICSAVRDKGAFVRYNEKSRSLIDEVDRALKQTPNKKGKIQVCIDIVPWDPSPRRRLIGQSMSLLRGEVSRHYGATLEPRKALSCGI